MFGFPYGFDYLKFIYRAFLCSNFPFQPAAPIPQNGTRSPARPNGESTCSVPYMNNAISVSHKPSVGTGSSTNGHYPKDASKKDASRNDARSRPVPASKPKPMTSNSGPRNQQIKHDPLDGLLDDTEPPKIEKPSIPPRHIPEKRDDREKVSSFSWLSEVKLALSRFVPWLTTLLI